MAKEGVATARGLAKKQQTVRFYPEHEEILAEWAADLSPGMEPDRSALIRRILEITRPFRDDAIARLRQQNRP